MFEAEDEVFVDVSPPAIIRALEALRRHCTTCITNAAGRPTYQQLAADFRQSVIDYQGQPPYRSNLTPYEWVFPPAPADGWAAHKARLAQFAVLEPHHRATLKTAVAQGLLSYEQLEGFVQTGHFPSPNVISPRPRPVEADDQVARAS